MVKESENSKGKGCWTASLLGAAIPANVQLPITLDFTPDLRVLGWGLALSLATGLVFGLARARDG